MSGLDVLVLLGAGFLLGLMVGIALWKHEHDGGGGEEDQVIIIPPGPFSIRYEPVEEGENAEVHV